MSSTRLIIIRHGETVWNLEGRKHGQLDSPLTALGIRQAKALAQRMTEESFAALYSSDLGRAVETAEIIAARTNHEIIFDRRLRERNFGVFQGLTDEEVIEKYPLEHQAREADKINYVIPGGESLKRYSTRVVNCLEEVAARREGQSVALVTHGGVTDSWFRYIFDIPPDAPRKVKLWNASLNRIARDSENGWTLHSWGDVGHLRFSSSG
ncbi:MAG TPA: histidine phosphatase family protein [Pyrinomonadaceae bacterium]|nr:histidine phosphatase family protein [Pyrinomonadaceae bacterium]